MLDLNDFFYFVQVVERRGFTAAGRALGMPKSTLSYRMKKLEAELGVRLLNRASRHFAPTQRRQREVTLTLTPRMVSNDLSILKQAAVNGMGIAALPAYVCKSELRSRQLTRILPGWLAGESTFTALLPHRLGLLPAVRIFVDYLARHLPECVQP
jgi:DNA-binding transcriptional LysR family regulator